MMQSSIERLIDDAKEENMPPKHIVVCSDGTGNSALSPYKTNVWRIYEALDLADPQNPETPRQFAYYDDGVGTSRFRPLALLGGAFGIGLARNVVDLYKFICRIYKPGDRIYAFGFSRGAFTIRVLVGMLLSEGIVPYEGDELELDRLSWGAYQAWRRERAHPRSFPANVLVPLIRLSRDTVLHGWHTLRWGKSYRSTPRTGGRSSTQPLEIQFVGLWDTVDAYGLPVEEFTRAIDRYVFPLTMRDLNISSRVRRAMHALSIDDERYTFHPRLWNEQPTPPGARDIGVEGGNLSTADLKDERVSQVWFAGVHSNVGGGYPDDGLALVSYEWIVREAIRWKLRLMPAIVEQHLAISDANGPLYDSRRGLAGYYRYKPRRIERLADPSWGREERVEIGRVKIHETVLRRIKDAQDGYAPIALPPGFAVMRIDGRIVDGNTYLHADIGPGSRFAEDRERVWNTVWLRRAAYFLTLLATLLLLGMPLLKPGNGTCSGSGACWLSGAIERIGALLPTAGQPWIKSFHSHPVHFAVLAGIAYGGLRTGVRLERRIRDRMRAIWYGYTRTAPNGNVVRPGLESASLSERGVQWLRTQRAYRRFFKALSSSSTAGFLMFLAYAVLVAASHVPFMIRESSGSICKATSEDATGLPVASHLALTATVSADDLCTSTRVRFVKGETYRIHITRANGAPWLDGVAQAATGGVHNPVHDASREGVTDSSVVAGGAGDSKALTSRCAGDAAPAAREPFTGLMALFEPFRFGGPYAAHPNGVPSEKHSLWMTLGVPLRRHIGEPYLKLMGRIGNKGADVYPLTAVPSLSEEKVCEVGRDGIERCDEPTTRRYTAEVVARSSGEFFAYFNDAILIFPVRLFYGNNCGKAELRFERVHPPPEPPVR